MLIPLDNSIHFSTRVIAPHPSFPFLEMAWLHFRSIWSNFKWI